MINTKQFFAVLQGLTLSLTLGFINTAQALSLSDDPLFLTTQDDPNVFFEIDDSGSMDWEILTKPHFSSTNPGFFVDVGLMYEGGGFFEIYLYTNADNPYGNAADSINTGDWRARCACLNVLAYDPAVTYNPWVGLPNAVLTAARSDPQPGKAGYTITRNLTTDVFFTNWVDTNTDGFVSFNGDANTMVAVNTLTAAQQTNYANWYQYARRRSFIAKAAVADVIDQNPGFRYGLSVLNSSGTLFTEVPASGISNYSTHNNLLVNTLNNLVWPTFGTPLRTALERTGDYFDNTLAGKADPIISECQKNFAILFTDGYWNGGNPNVGNADGDGQTNTLADVAKAYYDTDLSPLADNVPPDTFDTNVRQHMVTFTVAFGINGLLIDTDADGWPNPVLAEAGNWGNAFNSNAEKVDDLWHAAFNGKGTFIAAQTPQDVSDSLNNALANIAARTSSASSVALNAGSIGANSRVYQAKFDTDRWSGQLLSYSIATDLTIATTPNWDAGCKITGGPCATTATTETVQNWDTGREIITFSSGTGVPFRWLGGINAAQQADLNQDTNQSPALVDALGQGRLEFLRGNRTLEDTIFRKRDSVLGDVVNASPIFIGAPSFDYSNTLETASYSAFRSTYENRTPIIWFGANDGMIHGINADISSSNQGKEVLAYVPSTFYNRLNELSSLNYQHQQYVNAPANAGDVFYGSAWHTVLVNGLAKGGQSFSALNVTDPASFNESNAASLALWEFSDSDDVDMGYSYGRAQIVRLNNGKWAAIFGNGLDNTDADGTPSTTGNAVIYIVDIQTGSLIKKFDTKKGMTDDPLSQGRPNGIVSVSPIDADNNETVDYIYAGDLFGNVWKIDISDDGGTTTNWKFGYGTTSSPTPLFIATDDAGLPQPITTAPSVSGHPDGGFLVYFGTGKYVETSDSTQIAQQTQSFYGIWDRHESTSGVPTLTAFTRQHLLAQQITEEKNENFDIDGDGIRDAAGVKKIRISTDKHIIWHPTTYTLPTAGASLTSGVNIVGNKGIALGWFIDLVNTGSTPLDNHGERQVTDSLFLGGTIVFNTIIPSDNPCAFGGESWTMALNGLSGERVDKPVFDLSPDGVYDINDATVSAENITGFHNVGINSGLTNSGGYGNTDNAIFYNDSTGKINSLRLKGESEIFARQSWQTLIE